MAVNLARSFLLTHQNSDIKFFIATDSELAFPPDLRGIDRIQFKPGEYGHGFSTKLCLDKLAPAEKTLFIDSDCLIFGSLDPLFARFAGKSVSTIGHWISSGEFFGNVEKRCSHFHTPQLPYFVGALYYLEPSQLASEVFDFARRLETEYDMLGFVRLRGRPNEEPLISLALAKFEQNIVQDVGDLKQDAMFWIAVKCSVFEKRALVLTQDKRFVHSVILHFNDSFSTCPPYTSESLKLSLVMRYGVPEKVANLLALILVTFPYLVEKNFKDALRPLYRRLFGSRRVLSARP